jgi:hypothetical protein
LTYLKVQDHSGTKMGGEANDEGLS